MWNLEKWFKWTYLQSGSKATDVENKLWSPRGKRSGVNWEIGVDVYVIPCLRQPTNEDIWNSTVICGDLNGKEIWKWVYICICIHVLILFCVHQKLIQHWKANTFQSVQSLSCVRLFANPGIAAPQASLSITNSQSSLKPMSIESVMPSNHLILCRPLLLLPPSPPNIRVFSNESTLCIRWPTYWSFSFSISPSNEHPGLISFRMDWLDLLAVQGTLKSLLQHHSSEASILCSAFFIV